VSSTALTTFGKPNPNQNIPQPPTQPPVRAKECKSHSDCFVLQNTSCVKEYYDDRYRCLCGDYTAPVNGFCTAKFKGEPFSNPPTEIIPHKSNHDLRRNYRATDIPDDWIHSCQKAPSVI
uniref:EGF-like domain-containing protein n=1 Tax=Phlebotomus papatasi TaxID=29031 RepID=A0A1B0GMW8_PHLPP